MASLVSEILMSAGQLEKRDLQTEIEKVNVKIEDAKFQVVKFLEQHFNDFNPLLIHSRELAETSSRLQEEISQLSGKAETELKFQLQCSTSELTTISSQINAAKAQVGLLENVTRLHDILEELKKINLEDGVVKYAQLIAQAEKIINESEDQIETELHIWSSIRFELEKYKDHLIAHLDDCWNNEVDWEKNETLTLKLGPVDRLCDIFRALSSVSRLDGPLLEFSTRLLEDVLISLCICDSKINCEEDIRIAEGSESMVDIRSLAPVLENLSVLFDYLHNHLDFVLDDGQKALVLIGRSIGEDFAKNFVKRCLKPTLPPSCALLSSPEYLEHLKKISQFEQSIRKLGLLPAEGPTAISEFINNVDVFYADKECLESMAKARQLMCLELHETLHLKDNQADQTVTQESGETAHLWKMLSEGGLEMKWSPFIFPNCQISRSTQELIELLSSLVNEAVINGATERCAARLLYTVRSICELYLSVVPEYHRDSFQKLPFHAAVAHNNGMYLAHSLLTLGTSHLIKIPNQNTVPLMDLVGKFRQGSAQIFLDHMKRQRDQLTTMLKDGGFNRLGGESKLPESAEKASRQCLHHLGNLQKIWQPVLPEEVYLRAIGTLCNSVLEELLVRITTLEDIPADAAIQLADQCQIISNKLPLLFVQPTEDTARTPSVAQVVHFVPLWNRFQELQLLLQASLKNIEDRWASGKGPLALHFSADEVKHMIRALFQNTDHRAAVLARIK